MLEWNEAVNLDGLAVGVVQVGKVAGVVQTLQLFGEQKTNEGVERLGVFQAARVCS